MTLSTYTRLLNADDAGQYRALRQSILEQGGGKYFSDSYIRESSFKAVDWKNWCSPSPQHCIIGTFHGQRLIGIMGIIAYGPAQDCAAEWELTWVDPEYRGMGISRASYQIEESWTVAHGYKKAVVFIREDNTRSMAIRKKQGFIFQHDKSETWADGSVAKASRFEKTLTTSQTQRERALNYLVQTLVDFVGTLDAVHLNIQNG